MSCCDVCFWCRCPHVAEEDEFPNQSDSSYEDEDTEDYLTVISDHQDWDSLHFPPAWTRSNSGESGISVLGVMQSLKSFVTCSGESFAEEEESNNVIALPDFNADWWRAADLSAARCCAGLSPASDIIAARVVRGSSHGELWRPAAAGSFYEETGAVDGGNYVAVWIHLGDAALVFLSKAGQGQALDACMASSDALQQRLKLLINPVAVKLPFPCKAASDAETVGAFFGHSAWTDITVTSSGAQVYSVRVDLFSKWLLKFAMQKVGFQLGNCVEMILVDWPGRAVLGAVRLQVTSSFLELTA